MEYKAFLCSVLERLDDPDGKGCRCFWSCEVGCESGDFRRSHGKPKLSVVAVSIGPGLLG